jgi:hypothetical protein
MSNLSDLLPSGGGQNIVDFTASGTVASGKPVALNSNGTVSQVAAIAEAVGTEANYVTNNTSYTQCVFDPDTGKTIIAYQDHKPSSDKGMVVVATPTASGTISLGTPVEFSTTAGYIAMTYDTGQNKVLLTYRGGSNHCKARVGTVSGTTISFGTELTVEAENCAHTALAYDPDLGSHLVVYDYDSASGKARVLTVSGTSVTSGSAVTFDSSQVSQTSVAYDESADKYVLSYRDHGNSYYGTAVVVTVSGTTPSFGSAVVFESANTIEIDNTYDSSAQKVVITYRDLGNSNRPTAIVGTVSGTSVSFGTAVVVASVETTVYEAAYDSINKKVVVTYRDEDATPEDNGAYAAGTVSGTSISFATPGVFNSGVTTMSGIAFDTTLGKFVIAYNDYRGSSSNTPYGTAVTLQLASTNVSDFIGLADAAISDTATGKINVKGSINSKQSSLTIGSDYYVQSDGSISTTSTSPAVKVGQAVTATTINMMDLT